MNGAAFFILTTEGPVAIQRISEEDQAVSSVICLDGLTQILPISASYDAFVRSPAGVIERMTGHGAYRMDVAARIDEGRSWQLAAFLAHAARLKGGVEEITVFATGEVDSALAVRPVEHVDLKLKALARFLADDGSASEKAVILVPDSTADLPQQIGGIPLRKLSSIAEALQVTGIEMPLPSEVHGTDDADDATVRRQRTRTLPFLFAAALIAAVLFWVGGDFARWSALFDQGRILELEQDMAKAGENGFGRLRADAYRVWRDISKPDAKPDLSGVLFVADRLADCADTSKRQKRPMTSVFKDAGTICMVEIRGIAKGSAVLVGRLAYWPDGLGQGERPARTMRGSQDPSGRTWTLEFDNPPQPGAALRLVVISGAVDIRGSQPWYQDLLAASLDSAVFNAAQDRLIRLGFAVTALDWQRP